MPSCTLAFFQFFNRKLNNSWWILQGHTYIVLENKERLSNSQKGWRYELLNRKVFIKLSWPKPLRTKVKNCKKWSINDFPWFLIPYTNVLLLCMIVLTNLGAQQPLKPITQAKKANFTGLWGRHLESYIFTLDHQIYILVLGTCISTMDMLLGVICIGFTMEFVLFRLGALI